MDYQSYYRKSIEEPEAFWGEEAEKLQWYKFPNQILQHEGNEWNWFADGEMNTCYMAVDYHVENGRGDQVAIYYDSPVSDTKSQITFSELRDQVARFAGALKARGVEKGDTVVIYMPMVPEVLVAMLACARLGAIHSVVFGGFASHELAIRINDAKPKLLLTSSCGIEIGKVIAYQPLVDAAIEEADHKPDAVVVLHRPQAEFQMKEGRDLDWYGFQEGLEPADPVPVKATDPLYILYTSGTTGQPKGVVRQNGGHAVAMRFSMEYIYDVKPGEVFWAASDVGWVVGHSYIVYAPLLHGCSTIVYEGKPVRTPDAGGFWRVMEEYKVSAFFTAPTAFRAVKKEDPNGELLKKYDLSSVRAIYQAGERLDPPTYEWLSDLLKKPILDHWWQTETGWGIAANPAGIKQEPVKSGSATFPVPGYQLHVLDEAGNVLGPNEQGALAIKLPMPPSCLNTLWNNHERFVEAYLDTYPGYYLCGDDGYIDEDGYVFVMGRIDDVINVAGHRLSTGEMEEVVASHDAIAECAVVGINDELKGQLPVAFYIRKDGVDKEPEEIQKELIQMVRGTIGAICCFSKAMEVKRLPKTRSGKILRKTIRQISETDDVPTPATIDDPGILDEIREAYKTAKVGRFV
ncbi:propionyl-CoA synthetase [Solemya velum gill symbiont]|uniref:propionyl-CoA synthetase n=1 Tax=Solemya velum gill symbiont TaxID=2340 RepID=UPI000998C0DB|nr:propionyl-CoA synthetase [Solemya velum gill symbiont]OOY52694.1 propionyl-CoA synthetase [Solemya velum gill symbiont]OOY65785.1 propionyl-CoA synthetase [Solemya velum gill symbiont]OOY67819.1 propionyl-CoA synthetase [Solemya velum gill symbiont]OOY70278.1 propionyl-CoA synthetase [Solemya velum gill symbiont]OOY80017.1 propionyl-CoA synthetase [Solemya velum gill symbiont]